MFCLSPLLNGTKCLVAQTTSLNNCTQNFVIVHFDSISHAPHSVILEATGFSFLSFEITNALKLDSSVAAPNSIFTKWLFFQVHKRKHTSNNDFDFETFE